MSVRFEQTMSYLLVIVTQLLILVISMIQRTAHPQEVSMMTIMGD